MLLVMMGKGGEAAWMTGLSRLPWALVLIPTLYFFFLFLFLSPLHLKGAKLACRIKQGIPFQGPLVGRCAALCVSVQVSMDPTAVEARSTARYQEGEVKFVSSRPTSSF